MSEAAFLRYSSLGLDGDVIRAMEQSFWGFKPLYEHLKQSKDYILRPENVSAARWSHAPDHLGQLKDEGVWIELAEPASACDRSVELFERFFDEYTTFVFDVGGPGRSAPRIRVLDRVPDRRMLFLESLPIGDTLEARVNTYVLDQQLKALRTLQNQPQPGHAPLLRLVQDTRSASWPDADESIDIEWQVLTDDSRLGSSEQREFVRKALSTPDFALLEGPPGSGKTTAICELIAQMVRKGKRVLLCGSTHVAVDNVLERLITDEATADHVIAVRIGDRAKCSERVRHLRLDDRVETERRHLVDHLEAVSDPTLAQEMLLDLLASGERDRVQRLVLDVANVICGTTIGILQHPDIRKSGGDSTGPMYDMLIVDEASKTTLQEFLVPGVLAKRWVLVGDVRQLSPYVDESELRAALEPVARSVPLEAQVGVDMLRLARTHDAPTIAVLEDSDLVDRYTARANSLGVSVRSSGSGDLTAPGVVVMDRKQWRGSARAEGLVRRSEVDDASPAEWSSEVAWRLSMRFQQRLLGSSVDRDRFDEDLRHLLPESDTSGTDIAVRVRALERIAMPSILESLERGYGVEASRGVRTALADGIPAAVLAARHEMLRYQYRMHPQISAFPRTEIYDDEALRDAADLERSRAWDYNRYTDRVAWLDVRTPVVPKTRRNDGEVTCIVQEVDAFAQWAGGQPSGRPWSIAVICFYRDQERALRRALREMTGQRSSGRFFEIGSGPNPVQLDLCTVDGFQGQEADVVMLSIALPRTTAFTRSLNRVNVALTRARYQLVIVGNRSRISRERPSLLQALASRSPATIAWTPE